MYGIDFEEILKRLIVGLNRKTTGSESIDIKNDSDLLNGAN
jgi:hypothetical protein